MCLCVQVLRDVWPLRVGANWAYSQKRIEHVFRVVGAAVAGHMQAKLLTKDLWTTPFHELKVRGTCR